MSISKNKEYCSLFQTEKATAFLWVCDLSNKIPCVNYEALLAFLYKFNKQVSRYYLTTSSYSRETSLNSKD